MIAVDAMGGDFAPRAIVQGSYQAANRGIPILLFGDSVHIKSILLELSQKDGKSLDSLPITIEHTTQIIGMEAEPGRAVLQAKDSSLVRAVQAVADGTAHAIVSAGNSGAALVAGTLILERVPGVLRPAIGDFLPTKSGSVFVMDLGANTDCKPEYLEQFALMGHAYVSMIKAIARPRIALLSNGHEPYKGSLAVKQTYDLLRKSKLNFVGNIEPRELFDDLTDVIVCDGFVGNVMLKTMQGTAKTLISWIDTERSQSWLYTIGLLLSKGLFRGIKNKMDYAKKGGALLLGVKKPLIVAHGSSNAVAIEHAIVFAHKAVQERVIERFNAQLASLLPAQDTFVGAQRLDSHQIQQ